MQVETLLTNAHVYNTYTKQFRAVDVAINEGRFVAIGTKEELAEITAKETIDVAGKQLIPGLIDIHLHIESSMVTPETFSYALLQNGVTTIVPEPHEMANVFGIEGVRAMISASDFCTVDMMYAIPSSVPATSLETTGGEIGIKEIDELMATEQIQCLGEIMNYVDVLNDSNSKTNQILTHFREKYPNTPIEGHVPKLTGMELDQIMLAGIGSDHTHQTEDGLRARIEAGMFVQIQEKSMTDEVMQFLIQNDVSEHFCFVTDDIMTDVLLEKGHLNILAKKAVAAGMRYEDVIYACTATPAKRMNMTDRGAIAVGKIADFSIVEQDQPFTFQAVYKNGVSVFERSVGHGQQVRPDQFPAHFYKSVHLPLLTAEDFMIHTEKAQTVRVMNVADGSTFTKETHVTLPSIEGELNWQGSDCRLIATFERHKQTGNRAHGLISGDIITSGAIATTYSHDNHNLLVIGTNIQDMVKAANTVIESNGGFCVVENDEVKAFLALPIGGILSEAPLAEVGQDVKQLVQAMKDLGYQHYNPIMSVSTLSLPVSPALKITDHGLVDVNRGCLVSLFL
ncbi:amidohydrolase family protein [Alkalihalobacillus sp. LMS6]|uniref:adenine deaminase C-terminal domain-containing protein n=1 Tax=Alkalihalobacillus sp. LMS6 TaxID=2924034 RepID=UPI0020D0338C|nr:adenine deaminase C-terminal domain-containing protein [Alkalihalobacillus sp. LMS6]UTR08223.1 amidohydrolase family protein [Alkalihalobacillus sp. LMS6]